MTPPRLDPVQPVRLDGHLPYRSESALRRRNEHLSLLATASQLLIFGQGSERGTLAAVFESVATAVGAEIYLHYQPHDASTLALQHAAGLSEDERKRFAMIPYGAPPCGRVAASQRSLVLEDIPSATGDGVERVRAAGFRAYAGFPLLADDRLLGTVAFITRDRTRFAEDELQLIHSVCDQVAAMLDRNRLSRALQRSEERMQQALRVNRSFTFEWDPLSDHVHRSASCSEILGLPQHGATHTLGKTFFQSIAQQDRDRFLALVGSLTPASPDYAAEYRFTRQDGSTIELGEMARGTFDAEGRLIRLVGVVTDITARKRIEDQLRLADRQKDEFLAMLSHELRNPLAPIGNATTLLTRMLKDDTRVREPLAMIGRQIDQLRRLVDDLLDVSRIARGRVDLRKETLQVGDIVAQAVETVQPMASEKRQVLRVQCPQPDLHVWGDRARLVQALGNLLHNASKYSDTEGRITVQVTALGTEVEIAVRDEGVGIAADLLPQVFELFVQSERSLDRAEGGLGIGLSVVRGLIAMHGGSVRAQSAGPNQGATFTIRLPRSDAAIAAGEPSAPDTRTPRRRILVVDDNVDAAESLAMLLSLDGHEVQSVHDAAQALQCAGSWHPDLAFLDIGMPHMDGYEMAAHIRADAATAGIVLVALTGYGQASDRTRALQAGFDAHLIKPLLPDDLAGLLGSLDRLRPEPSPQSG